MALPSFTPCLFRPLPRCVAHARHRIDDRCAQNYICIPYLLLNCHTCKLHQTRTGQTHLPARTDGRDRRCDGPGIGTDTCVESDGQTRAAYRYLGLGHPTSCRCSRHPPPPSGRRTRKRKLLLTETLKPSRYPKLPCSIAALVSSLPARPHACAPCKQSRSGVHGASAFHQTTISRLAVLHLQRAAFYIKTVKSGYLFACAKNILSHSFMTHIDIS
jgi:hypothetical protein